MGIVKYNNKKYSFLLEMEVRDYELDCEQIVNNANYLHYFEHTRHMFCRAVGVSFIELHKVGLDAVVRKIEVEYLSSLHGDEKFISGLRMERRGPRFIFHQDIFRPNGDMVAKGVVTVVILRDGRLTRGDELVRYFEKFL